VLWAEESTLRERDAEGKNVMEKHAKKQQEWDVCCVWQLLYAEDNKNILRLCLCGLGYSAIILHFNFKNILSNAI
jgi:hypothetical protein